MNDDKPKGVIWMMIGTLIGVVLLIAEAIFIDDLIRFYESRTQPKTTPLTSTATPAESRVMIWNVDAVS